MSGGIVHRRGPPTACCLWGRLPVIVKTRALRSSSALLERPRRAAGSGGVTDTHRAYVDRRTAVEAHPIARRLLGATDSLADGVNQDGGSLEGGCPDPGKMLSAACDDAACVVTTKVVVASILTRAARHDSHFRRVCRATMSGASDSLADGVNQDGGRTVREKNNRSLLAGWVPRSRKDFE